jgi:hypothetical protein
MSKKHKFDLTTLVRHGHVKAGETLFFISNPAFTCTIKMMPNHEYKVEHKAEIYTVHAMSQKFLGTESPDHASKWLRTQKGTTLYDLWQQDLAQEEAA